VPKQTKVRLSVVLCQIGQSYNDIIAVGNVGDPVQSIIITIGHFDDFFFGLLVGAPFGGRPCAAAHVAHA
jgi:hypothetical protein